MAQAALNIAASAGVHNVHSGSKAAGLRVLTRACDPVATAQAAICRRFRPPLGRSSAGSGAPQQNSTALIPEIMLKNRVSHDDEI
jgi:hypothetical protein